MLGALCFVVAVLWGGSAEARTQLDILIPEELASAPPEGRWLVQGTLSFVPGALPSATRFTILEEPNAGEKATGSLTPPSPTGRGGEKEGADSQDGSAQGAGTGPLTLPSPSGSPAGPGAGGEGAGARQPDAGAREVPIRVTGEVPYPDGSLMFVDISFPVTLAEVRSHRYWLASAPRGRASEYQPEAGVELPVLTFVLREESAAAPPSIDMPVGEMMVRVDQHPGLYYYWYLVPMGAILTLLIWRKVHLR